MGVTVFDQWTDHYDNVDVFLSYVSILSLRVVIMCKSRLYDHHRTAAGSPRWTQSVMKRVRKNSISAYPTACTHVIYNTLPAQLFFHLFNQGGRWKALPYYYIIALSFLYYSYQCNRLFCHMNIPPGANYTPQVLNYVSWCCTSAMSDMPLTSYRPHPPGEL
jgi:hypothetical protein